MISDPLTLWPCIAAAPNTAIMFKFFYCKRPLRRPLPACWHSCMPAPALAVYEFNGCSNQLIALNMGNKFEGLEYVLCSPGVHEGGWVFRV